MKRRIARKILKRIKYKSVQLAVNLEHLEWDHRTRYKRDTILKASNFHPKADLVPGTLDHPKTWGMIDRDTDTWMGTNDCPLTYADYEITRLMARIMAARLEWSPLRIIVTRFTTATKKLDDLTPEFSAEEALERIMTGVIV